MSKAVKYARRTTHPYSNRRMAMSSVGDPGIFGFLGGVGKAVLGGVTGLVKGVVSSVIPKAPPAPAPVPGVGWYPEPRMGTPGIVPRTIQQAPTPTGVRVGGLLPGGASPYVGLDYANGAGTKLACPSGYHPNKSDYFLKDGTFIQAGTKCVKNRRRNALNPRALDRAISRVEGAKRASKKMSRITVRKQCPSR